MIRFAIRRCWPVLAVLGCMLSQSAARADGPIPVSTNWYFSYRFDLKAGPAAFARPAGPWYSYFPMDSNLLAQPRASAFPNWPTTFPPATPAPRQPLPGPMPGQLPPPMAPMSYYAPQAMPYAYGPAVYPVSYYAPPGYWYGR